MKMTKKQPAFTVIEVLLTIAITGVVISLIYVIYVNFSKQVYSFFHNSIVSNEVHAFYQQMKVDAFQSNKMQYINNEIIFSNYNTSEVRYKKEGDSIYRYFKENKGAGVYVNNITVKPFNLLSSGKQLAEKISLESKIYDQPIQFTIFKNYPMTFMHYGNRSQKNRK